MPATDWKSAFLVALAGTGNVSASAGLAGISRQYSYEARKADPAFALAWDVAIEEGIDGLEAEARRRALAGSDMLLIFLLKAHRPEKYRDNLKLEHGGTRKIIVEYADDLELAGASGGVAAIDDDREGP